MNSTEKYMHRCLQLAKLGERRVAPNPMVGCVVVHNDQIIGEGFHQKYGEAHAEVNAICSVVDQTKLKQSTLYVNLEPCAHYGKTPPCADLIVDTGIPKVVIGTIDPFAEVAGKGIEKLEKNGVEVELGVLSEQCLELNRRFFTFHREKRPYIILKWAQTADGFVDIDRTKTEFGQPTWITNEMARIAVHKQRATESAIFIGTETALKDNPSLTLRDWYGEQPLRIVPDRRQRLPASLNIFNKEAPSALLTPQTRPDQQDITIVAIDREDDVIDKLMDYLYENRILSVIVEGGPRMLQSFIDRKMWDEAHVYIGQLSFKAGIKAPVFNYSPVMFDRFYNSELRIFRNH
jgi:diaminohydroxyphosphoribosylaminopyrimidine deaminase / 5-amino-6-(5-phosphoribosylamino)uracil reductase